MERLWGCTQRYPCPPISLALPPFRSTWTGSWWWVDRMQMASQKTTRLTYTLSQQTVSSYDLHRDKMCNSFASFCGQSTAVLIKPKLQPGQLLALTSLALMVAQDWPLCLQTEKYFVTSFTCLVKTTVSPEIWCLFHRFSTVVAGGCSPLTKLPINGVMMENTGKWVISHRQTLSNQVLCHSLLAMLSGMARRP